MKTGLLKLLNRALLIASVMAMTDCQTTKDPVPASTGGSTGSGSGVGTTAQTGTATFFIKEDLGVGVVTVYVDGNLEGTISHYHASGVTCGQGDVNVTKPAGTYSFKATGGNQVWEGTITIKNGVCQAQELQKSASGGGGSTATGQVTFWTAQTSGWSSIDVSVGGSYVGSLSKYYASAPSCGASGCVTITKAPGTYAFTAKSKEGATWSGNVTVSANGCTTNQLTFDPNNGGGTCDWTYWNSLVKMTRYEYDPKGSYCANNTGITYLEVQNLSNQGLSIDFCFKKADGTWYCAFQDTGAGDLMKTNICTKAQDLKIWVRPYGKSSACPFPKP